MSKTCLAAPINIATDVFKSHVAQCFTMLDEGEGRFVRVHLPVAWCLSIKWSLRGTPCGMARYVADLFGCLPPPAGETSFTNVMACIAALHRRYPAAPVCYSEMQTYTFSHGLLDLSVVSCGLSSLSLRTRCGVNRMEELVMRLLPIMSPELWL